MIDNLLSISKTGIRSVFTVKKYNSEILDEDLNRSYIRLINAIFGYYK